MHPLTLDRAKPAVPFGGRYRIIDIVLSNVVNSGLFRIKVLTQYKSASLEEHIARTWRLSALLDNYIETIPAQQRTGVNWYKGSADAVFQCKHVLEDEMPDLLCVFGGDHIYKMDLQQMISFHRERGAHATVAAIPVPRREASAFGVLEVDASGQILAFHEKVQDPPTIPGNDEMCLASMGNYVFQAPELLRELERDAALPDDQSKHDFGHDVLPHMVQSGAPVFAYDFMTNLVPGEKVEARGYWRDVGTVDAYWEAQMDLIAIEPHFNLYNESWVIRTSNTHQPPAKFVFKDEAQARIGSATDSLVSHGCIISGGRIHRSVLSVGCRVNSFADIQDSVLFERVKVGRHAKIRRAIIDKDVELPPGIEIGYNLEHDRRRFSVSDNGIVVVPKRMRFDP